MAKHSRTSISEILKSSRRAVTLRLTDEARVAGVCPLAAEDGHESDLHLKEPPKGGRNTATPLLRWEK